MKLILQSLAIVIAVSLAPFGMYLLSSTQRAEPYVPEVENDYTPQDFNKDYEIDLKQDGFLILDEKGDVFFVPNNMLEEWFAQDNL